MTVPRERIEWMREGDAFFLERLDSLPDDALREPSGLPDWTRAHVVSHFSRNARGLMNLLDWARTGVATPMYPSVEARAEDIEEGSHQDAATLRAEAHTASQQLNAAVAAMPDDAWDGAIRTALGRDTTGAEVPWMRVRESWVHAVDLAAGGRVDQLPDGVVVALADEVALMMGTREGTPSLALHATDTGRRWVLRDGAVVVEGSQADLLAWLIGRSKGDGLHASSGALPDPPRWL
ncbi:MAG TPA: maleylpyruvate isomerase family mycothiol-dependent enzyme [Acidimicrobiales bacterium]|nr:maleylpyruvate isomerase family mycothiol-dependent enzyme [Acidimicrobiales bacterium]